MTVHLQQFVLRDAAFQTRLVKGVKFVSRSYTKGYLFCQKWCVKNKGLDLRAEPPGIKLRLVPSGV